MNDVSEAEVEAVRNAIQRVLFEVGIRVDELARAALTAAAQVRERALPPCVFEARGPNGEAPAGLGGGRAWCRTHGFDCPQLQTGPATQRRLMPIYGATEPDQGEDKLGMRKGEG